MIDEERTLQFLFEYEDYVRKGNEILQDHFGIKKSPLVARRKGEIPKQGKIVSENLVFSFHGRGCQFDFGEVIVNFDYSPDGYVYTGFHVYDLALFIGSRSGIDVEIVRKDIRKSLRGLELKRVVINRDESPFDPSRKELPFDPYDYILNRDAV